ncbi:MAG: MFS transporter [Planctomycetes bacterium]|nr:MFS transporter [Planctomycetota bacterium]
MKRTDSSLPIIDGLNAQNRNILGAVIGNVLEWYDFAVFGYFASTIGTCFFPLNNKTASLISAFGVFAVAYFMRPIGGALFGHMGDKIGRKQALQMSVLLMAVPTFAIGILPTWDQAGIMAPILLILMRMIQGLSVGGELIGSISFLTEIAPEGKKGKYGSWAECSSLGGIMLGSFVVMILHFCMDPLSLNDWGWRLPFMAGLLIGLFGLWMRSNLEETETFTEMKNKEGLASHPLGEVFKNNKGLVLHLVALVMLPGGGFYLLYVWWPTMMTELHIPPIEYAMLSNTLSMLFLLVLIPFAGKLSDAVGRKKVLVFGALGIALVAHPLFVIVQQGSFFSALFSQLVFAIFMSFFLGPIPATMSELFPANIRFSGSAIGYNISLALFGGTAPLVSTWLVVNYGGIPAASYYLIFLSLISLVATFYLPEHCRKSSSVPETRYEVMFDSLCNNLLLVLGRIQKKVLSAYKRIFVLD